MKHFKKWLIVWCCDGSQVRLYGFLGGEWMPVSRVIYR